MASRESVGLPHRNFLYTLDQISTILMIEQKSLMITHVFFVGRSTGIPSLNALNAVNIAPPESKPDWRVEEKELIRWMRRKGFRGYAS